MRVENFLVLQEEAGGRLDVYLAQKTGESRAAIQRLIREDQIWGGSTQAQSELSN